MSMQRLVRLTGRRYCVPIPTRCTPTNHATVITLCCALIENSEMGDIESVS